MKRTIAFGIAIAASLTACSNPTKRLSVGEGQLVGMGNTARLQCPHRLREVSDARLEGEQSGRLGANQLETKDLVDILKKQLLEAGFSETASSPMPEIAVRIKRFYFTSNHVSRMPIAVFEVVADDQSPFLVRSQKTVMNWSSSESNAYAGLSQVFQNANQQLITLLNAKCPASPPVSGKAAVRH